MVIKIIQETAKGIQERYAIEMEALGMDKDHIHLLSSAHPKISPGEIVRIFKSITAREIFRFIIFNIYENVYLFIFSIFISHILNKKNPPFKNLL